MNAGPHGARTHGEDGHDGEAGTGDEENGQDGDSADEPGQPGFAHGMSPWGRAWRITRVRDGDLRSVLADVRWALATTTGVSTDAGVYQVKDHAVIFQLPG
jgi:hypothetical protein